MTNTTPTVFDTFVSEITKGLDDILDTVRKDFNGPKEGYTEETQEEAAPVAPEQTEAADPLSVEGLAEEAIRILKAAEDAEDYLGEGAQLISIADRYIRLTELALSADIALG